MVVVVVVAVVRTRSRVGPCRMAVTVGAHDVEQALQISAERNNNPSFVWNQQADTEINPPSPSLLFPVCVKSTGRLTSSLFI